MPAWVAEVAHYMTLGPPLFLLARREQRIEYWWLALALCGLPFLSDSGAHLGSPWLFSAVYPVGQSALVAAVLFDRTTVRWFTGGLVAIGILLVALLGLRDSTLPLRLFAWGWLTAGLWTLPLGKLRTALLVAFGLGLVGWLVFTWFPVQPAWALYHGIRAASLYLFCRAVMKPTPELRIA